MSGQSAVAFGAKIVVFGGMNMAEQMIYNDVWVLDTGMLTMRAQRVQSLQILRSCPRSLQRHRLVRGPNRL